MPSSGEMKVALVHYLVTLSAAFSMLLLLASELSAVGLVGEFEPPEPVVEVWSSSS